MQIEPKLRSVYKFYFLEYFYILLKSIDNYENIEKVFESFKKLKHEHKLGESKYKKLSFEKENLTKTQEDRYQYTFNQVINESEIYNLMSRNGDKLVLKSRGRELLDIYQKKGLIRFNRVLFKYMEDHYYAFYYLVRFCYLANQKKNGLLIFPSYSPLKLQIERSQINSAGDIIYYSEKLKKKLEEDISIHLGLTRNLEADNKKVIEQLQRSKLLPENKNDLFNPQNYNVIIKRFRDFWLSHFLQKIYEYDYSLISFDIWIYRGKQIGILHATEFFPDPDFNGRIVYPTSIIVDFQASCDFKKIYSYNNKSSLFVHQPSWENEQTQNNFVRALTDAYFDIRKTHRSYFVNLADVRELVCYNLKIPEFIFDDFLKEAYKLNIKGELRISFSLEADKLPQETNAMYLKREPIMIDDRYRNIIAIDITRKDK